MRKPYRKGALGAMMDEYERAASELGRLVEQIPDDEFVRIVDPQTSDENCRSVQTIMTHVVSAGYGYADHIRQSFSIASTPPSEAAFFASGGSGTACVHARIHGSNVRGQVGNDG